MWNGKKVSVVFPAYNEMEYAYLGEILTGSECGRMD